ncbi:Tetrapyrrole (Corrin Porphyrin) methylase family protein [Ligilactobacillus hayakitensis DSM 18933 = JCM 14209]|uniref:Ribosomal RNA small subunit methyltransferase I n=1 Tax=Ligilactobacillus hayakitensis DSM 18933 = JCM 14209 TaxID=1423755 RepID=A0A0R1WLD4_9LACO|nr:16S rRNA (cytidine(1402)-2'-O)-methyltransferase [Ligilactobacillus hayakitensis]KRM18317.1 Tetrapyrrole (Corrin Porphyrin) methylase family protein [Ligilactobacillus hayakitensis DSM 18933 = JCM 14209]
MVISKMSSFKGAKQTGSLFLVPTPIGNLNDMTPRAITTMQEVDLIAAEDTRNTQKLLNYFEIDTRQISFHEHNTMQRIPQLIEMLQEGKNIAQVSDAGMPSISDPGHELVKACIENEIPVVPLPGPNAALSALIASGLTPQPFYFYGFLPRKSTERKKEIEKLGELQATFILYESPHRLKKTIKDMLEVLGDRKVTLGRELTKQYEEFLRGTLSEAMEYAENDEVRGEFVVVVEGKNQADNLQTSQEFDEGNIVSEVQVLIDNGLKPNKAIKEIANKYNLKKQEVYNKYHQLD